MHLAVPNAVDRDTKLMIQLVEPTGGVLATATTLLNVTANIPVYAVKTQLIQGEHWDHSSPELMQERQGKAGNLDAAIASAAQDTVSLPTKHPAMTASDEVDTGWIKSSAPADLRKEPKATASVVGVIAKGTKLALSVGDPAGWK